MVSDVHSHSKLYTGIKSRCNVLSGTAGPGSGISDFLLFFLPWNRSSSRKGVKSSGTSENGD